MKDTDGSLIHAKASSSTHLAVPVVPSRTVVAIDSLREPVSEIGGLTASSATAWWAWPMMAGLPGGAAKIGMLGIGIASTILAAWLLASIIWSQYTEDRSFLHNRLARLPRRDSIAARAADMIRTEWDRAVIRTKTAKKDWTYGEEPRIMDIGLPSGAHVHIAHRRSGRTLVILEPKACGYHQFEAEAALGIAATSKIMDALTRIQTERLCFLLGVPAGQSTHALARILAEVLPCESDDLEHDIGGYDSHDPHILEKRRLKGVEIVVRSIRPKHKDRHVELLVYAPGIGILTLPVEGFTRIMTRRRRSDLRIAFGDEAPASITVPVFLGNARASRIAALAGQALRDDPALTDATGSPIRSLIEEHMPRLLAAHRDSTRTAQTSDIAEIDAVLDRGLDVVARALGDAIEGLNDRKLDALRTEVRFLETRHPDHAASPLALTAA